MLLRHGRKGYPGYALLWIPYFSFRNLSTFVINADSIHDVTCSSLQSSYLGMGLAGTTYYILSVLKHTLVIDSLVSSRIIDYISNAVNA